MKPSNTSHQEQTTLVRFGNDVFERSCVNGRVNYRLVRSQPGAITRMLRSVVEYSAHLRTVLALLWALVLRNALAHTIVAGVLVAIVEEQMLH